MDEIKYVEAGQLYDGTDPTYGEDQYVTVFECGRCGALVSKWREANHTDWHKAVGR